MPSALKIVLDVIAGAALIFALLMVFVVDKLMHWGAGPAPNTLTVHEIPVAIGKDPKRMKLAVTPTGFFTDLKTQQKELWDDMGKLLKELGEGYHYDNLTPQEMLLNPGKLDGYDVLFLTCAPDGEELREILSNFVGRGGILYASDWRYEAVAAAFPDMVNAKTRGKGDKQKLEAEIVDSALRDVLGSSTIHLEFNLPEWKTAAFSGPRVKTLIQGNYLRDAGGNKNAPKEYAVAPLMVKFTFGKGTVIFTSFHNEKQNSAVEKKLLQYLIFSLVTAGIDSEVQSTMSEQGFTPQRSNLLSTPRKQAISKTYENSHSSTLRFTLGFRNEGATLTLNIKSPDGKQFTKQSKSTLSVEVPGASAGTWTYSVTPDELPYDNFPFTVTVGEKK